MRVYIIQKCLAKRFILEDGNTCSNMHHVPKVKCPPPPSIKTVFLFLSVKFQESKYSSQLFDISLFMDS